MPRPVSLIVSCSFIGTLLLLVLAACSGDDGKPANGTSSGTTTTPPTTPEDSGAPETGTGAEKKKNAENCTKNEECESGICFVGGSGGGGGAQQYCAVPCTTANAATVCVAPFTGACNGKGFCKRD